jgi:trigger factor
MRNINAIKKIGTLAALVLCVVSTMGCNTKIKPSYGYNPSDYVQLGEYKGLKYSVDTEAIANEIITNRMESDQEDNSEYQEITTRGARDDDRLTLDFAATVGGVSVNGFSDNDYELILGTDTFTIDGFTDALYGMQTGETKVVQLTVPETFTTASEYAGKKIVFEITLTKLEQSVVPMITDAYVKEHFDVNTVDEYREQLREELADTISEQIEEKKKEAILVQLQEICTITGYPEDFLSTKTSEYEDAVKMYSLMLNQTVDEYCQENMGMSFDDYVKKNVAQEMIICAVAEAENIRVTEYEYKGDLEDFAYDNNYGDKYSFEEKYGKDKIVVAMTMQKAQDFIIENAVNID